MTASNEIEAASEPEVGRHIVRIGTWFLVPPPETVADNATVVDQLIEALRSDTRVLDVVAPDLNDYWTSRKTMYPDRQRTMASHILTGQDRFKVLELSNYLRFKVRVPLKNQQPHHGSDDIPSDTYWVAWNGISIFVMWSQESERLPISGGHVVEDILDDVLGAINCRLYVQSCGPGCDFGFIHTNLRTHVDDAVERYSVEPYDSRSVKFSSFVDFSDPLRDIEWVAMSFTQGLSDFATFKNVGRRIIDMEDAVRRDLSHLLGHYHEHTVLAASKYSPKIMLKRWKSRAWRKEAWSLIASIWLGMANIETMRRQWSTERSDMLGHDQVVTLLQRDYVSDDREINALEMDPIAETVNQVAAALNNRMAATATLWGALAGGLAGGAAGTLGGG